MFGREGAEDDSQRARSAGYKKFKDYMDKIGLLIEEPTQRIDAINRLSFKQFMQILNSSNSLLRNLSLRNKRNKSAQVGGDITGGAIIMPIPEPQKHLEQFFEKMKSEISSENLQIWAMKLYFAIIFAHYFEDGNGRLAREAYCILNGIENSAPSERSKTINLYTENISLIATRLIYNKELDLNLKDHKDFNIYFLTEVEKFDLPPFGNIENYLKLICKKKYPDQKESDVINRLLIEHYETILYRIVGSSKVLVDGFKDSF